MIRIDCRGLSTEDLAKSEQVQQAYNCLVKNGYAILDHVLPEDKVRDMNLEFNRRYTKYLQNQELEDTRKVGNRRFMVPIDLSGAFGDPLVYAHPFVVAVVRKALDLDAILESFGAVISLPGARAQHIHRDGRLLFDAAISPILPAHALTLVMPLIDMNDVHGTTAIWPGSHRWRERDEQAAPEAPQIPVGSCALWDFRLFHGGTANRSEVHRPILYATYARRWYQDTINFVKATQPRLVFDGDFLARVPEDRQSLFAHVR